METLNSYDWKIFNFGIYHEFNIKYQYKKKYDSIDIFEINYIIYNEK